MSQNDYRNSLAYINDFYSKHQIGGETETKEKLNMEPESPFTKVPAPPEISKFDKEDNEAVPIHLKNRKQSAQEWNPVSTPQQNQSYSSS